MAFKRFCYGAWAFELRRQSGAGRLGETIIALFDLLYCKHQYYKHQLVISNEYAS